MREAAEAMRKNELPHEHEERKETSLCGCILGRGLWKVSLDAEHGLRASRASLEFILDSTDNREPWTAFT